MPFPRITKMSKGAPTKHQSVITRSQIAQPKEEVGSNGSSGFPWSGYRISPPVRSIKCNRKVAFRAAPS